MIPSPQSRVLHVGLAGDMIEPLKLLLEDLLTDGSVPCELTSPLQACDVVIVMVSWGEELRAMEAARALAGNVPLLAVLPFSDDGLAERVLRAGASGWFALDTPLALLRASLLALTDLGSSQPPAQLTILP